MNGRSEVRHPLRSPEFRGAIGEASRALNIGQTSRAGANAGASLPARVTTVSATGYTQHPMIWGLDKWGDDAAPWTKRE